MDDVTTLRLAGLAAIVGALMYVAGDILLLAVRPDRAAHPGAARQADVLGDLEKLASLDARRIVVGGMLGVLGTPLALAGWWLLARWLAPAGAVAIWPAVVFGIASVIGGFAHGWFMALADTVRTLDRLGDDEVAAGAVVEVLRRQQRILAVAFIPVVGGAALASLGQAIVILGGGTQLPAWFAALTPIVTLALFAAVRRVLPAAARDRLEGTGFSVANLTVFLVLTIQSWDGIPVVAG